MRIFLITGFGLDGRAFAPLDLPGDFHAVDLIAVRRGETLAAYALRLAAQMGLEAGDVVGGVSLGGMLALEMAKAKGCRGVILIASCIHPRHIRRRFLWLSYVAPWVPESLIHRAFQLIPLALRWQNLLTPDGQKLLNDIMGAFPPRLLKTLPPLIRRWPGCLPTTPVRRIHSTGDWMIRPAGEPPPVLLQGKNHLITVSHPAEVRRFLLDAARDLGA